MIKLLEKLNRPFRWGFFISAAFALFTFLLQLGWGWYVRDHWENLSISYIEEDEKIIREEFKKLTHELFEISSNVRNDRALLSRIISNDRQEIVQGFADLNQYRSNPDLTIDIFDPRGNLICWVGRGEWFSARNDQAKNHRDSILTLTKRDLHSYLSAGLRADEEHLLIVSTLPFELNYPISNRFVKSVSFANRLSELLGRQVSIASQDRLDAQQPERHRVILRDPYGGALAALFVEMPTPESAIHTIQQRTQIIFSTSLGICSFLLLLLLIPIILRIRKDWARILLLALSIWALRYVWLVAYFPADVIYSSYFDPSHFGTTFGFGLARSAGETFLSALALFLPLLYARRVVLNNQSRIPFSSGGVIVKWIWVFLVSLVLILLTRAYGAAMRSFIFDSAIWYNDPTQLIPSSIAILMHVNALLLTLVLLILYQIGLVFCVDHTSRNVPVVQSLWKWGTVFIIFVISTGLYLIIERQIQFPLYLPLIIFVGTLFLLEGEGGRIANFLNPRKLLLPKIGLLLLFSFAVHSMSFDYHAHAKDRQEVEGLAHKLVRPADNWLSFIVSDGLSVITEIIRTRLENGDGQATRNLSAFDLWGRILVSREGYNSGVFVYDSAGSLRSKFVVGLSSYEQEEFLKRLYDYEEESLQIVERKTQTGTIKYYGIWGTIRDRQGQLQAIVSLMLSAGERALFWGDIAQPLRHLDIGHSAGKYRKIFISEYQNDFLTASTQPDTYIDERLDGDVRKVLDASRDGKVWLGEDRSGGNFQTLFMVDQSVPGRVVAISQEEFGWRWHISNLAKIFLVYVALFLLIIVINAVVRVNRTSLAGIGFRAKLIIALAILSVVPLVVIGIYNQRFAAERVASSLNRELNQKLALVHQKILSTISSEEDFMKGLTDDYCEVTATELAVDFTVFRRNELLASSRSELYAASILDQRLAGDAFANIVILGKKVFRGVEHVGDAEYAVGYQAIEMDGRIVGVLAVPTLYRQEDLELELAERNVFLLSLYLIVLAIVLIVVIFFANTLSKPLRNLTKAVRAVGRGNLDVKVQTNAKDEVGELVASFNEMTGEIKESRKELARVEREMAWKEMAKQVAHEIRNPLTPIKLSIQHLRQAYKDKAPDLDKIVHDMSQTVMGQIDVLTRIASEFSNFARMPERKYERVNIHETLTETITLFRDMKEIGFHSKFSDTDIQVLADKDELRRVFINIVRNAIQAMDKGGDIFISTELAGARCTIRLRDTGSGIPESLQEKVFQPNFSTKTEGMGLGLAISSKIIEDLNGTIRLLSKVGEGTTIEVVLPILSLADDHTPSY